MKIDKRLQEFSLVWKKKRVLRAVYSNYYQRILNACCVGRTLEVGGGTGNLKGFASDIISIDILAAPWLDVVCDAQRLPFQGGAFSNIVMFDVLHHIDNVTLFFSEVERILCPGGRLVCLEPAITLGSWLFYNFLHHELVDMTQDPLQPIESDIKDPYDSNQAIPTLLFRKHPERFQAAFPNLRLSKTEYLSLLAYPLSGGFQRWSLIPERLVEPLLKLENRLLPVLGRWLAFRLLAVVERC